MQGRNAKPGFDQIYDESEDVENEMERQECGVEAALESRFAAGDGAIARRFGDVNHEKRFDAE